MTVAERNLKDLILYLRMGKRPSKGIVEDYHGRDIVVTPFDGAYGHAGVVVALNGSPPRGLFLVTDESLDPNGYGFGVVWFDGGQRARVLSEQQAKVIIRFLQEQA